MSRRATVISAGLRASRARPHAAPLASPWRRCAGSGNSVADDRANELRALELMIEWCRAKATAQGVPALIPILDRAELSLSDHAARAGDVPRASRGPAAAVPRTRPTRH